MKPQLPLTNLVESLPLATQSTVEETASKAQFFISTEFGLILLGISLLAMSSYVFIAKLCKSLASRGSE